MTGRRLRLTLLSTIAALSAALSTFAPTFAQSGPVLGSWLAGPDGAGASTIVGRIETPTRSQNVASGASVLVSGWAADTTAAGWSGIDGVEVWSGPKGGSGTKLVTGNIGLARTDISEALGAYFGKSGFNAVVPAGALSSLKPGAVTLYVYTHTPGKGTWYRTAAFNLAAPAAPLAFASDPIVQIIKPQDGQSVTQLQRNSKFTFSGFALDRNPITNPANQLLGPGCSGCGLFGTQARGAGISSISAYIDTPPVKGDQTIFGNFGTSCGGCLYGNPLVSNLGSFNSPGKPQASIITRQFGSAFDYSGWSLSINPTLLSPGWHTLVVTATSSITGKQSTVSGTFQILDLNHKKIQP